MTNIHTTTLPEVVTEFLERSTGSVPATAIILFGTIATVTDSGTQYSGKSDVLDFLTRASTVIDEPVIS